MFSLSLSKKRVLLLTASTLACCAAQAQLSFLSLIPGVTNVVGQAAGNISNRAFSDDVIDIQAAFDKFKVEMAKQSQGMSDAALVEYQVMVDKHWALAEQSILLKNAKIHGAKDAPLVDFQKAAKATVGGVVDSASSVGGSIAAGATSAISNNLLAVRAAGAGSGKSAAIGFAAIEPTASDIDYVPSDKVNPLLYFGRAPNELNSRDLYRENGFLGWKRLEQDPEASAYAHITGQDPNVQYTVFNYDSEAGTIKAVFRVLKVSPAAFTSVVSSYSATMGEARYASEPTVMRAIWENGVFVTADAERLSVGWAASVPYMYALTTTPGIVR